MGCDASRLMLVLRNRLRCSAQSTPMRRSETTRCAISDLDAPFVSNFSRRHMPTRFPSRDYIARHLESPNRSMSCIASSLEGS